MRYLDLTLPSLAENLALDEALLAETETAVESLETLRIWESASLGVVIGRSSNVAIEVHSDACRELDVPVLRRISGGAAVVVGPGCLMYAVVLSLQKRPQLRSIDQAHAQVLGTMVTALRPSVPGIAMRGTCDLAIGEKKVSGNSVRCKRNCLLYHGTLLYSFPLDLVGRLLATPPRQPDYRHAREHDAFVANLPLDAASLRSVLRAALDASEACVQWPRETTQRLVAEKYSQREWND